MLHKDLGNQSLSSILIGSIVHSILTNKPTPLQIALGVLMNDKKNLLEMLSQYKITCTVTYSGVRRFRKSAAVSAQRSQIVQGLSDCSVGGLFQVIIDNFDASITSQNC